MKIRKVIQILTLILFIVLIVLGKTQIWMLIFLGSVLLSTIFGRFYCGYICPINTGMEIVDYQAKKTKRSRLKTPKIFLNSIIRYIILALFIATLVFVLISGKQLPALPILFAAGIIITIFFLPEFWHRYLCPYGALFSIFSKFNKFTYKVNNENCIKCGQCVRICPAASYQWQDKNDYPLIIKNECLKCAQCVEICPTKTIK